METEPCVRCRKREKTEKERNGSIEDLEIGSFLLEIASKEAIFPSSDLIGSYFFFFSRSGAQYRQIGSSSLPWKTRNFFI